MAQRIAAPGEEGGMDARRPEVSKGERVLYLDALRLVCTFAVMVIHLSATGYKTAQPQSSAWYICLSYNSAARFAVPVFVMISGTMHLDPGRNVEMVHMIRKLGKLMGVFLFWSVPFALTESLKAHAPLSVGYVLSCVQKTITGHYHMWYIYMQAGLYLATPFLRPVAADKRLLRWFILLSFLLNQGTGLLCCLPGVETVIGPVLNSADLGFFSGYTGYYLLGYYLHSAHIPKRKAVYAVALSALLLPAVMVLGIILKTPAMAFSEKLPHIFVYSAAVFLWFKGCDAQIKTAAPIRAAVEKITPCTLGMYLIHPAFNFLLGKAGIHALVFPPLLCVPLCSMLVYVLSYGVVRVMKKLLLINRFV